MRIVLLLLLCVFYSQAMLVGFWQTVVSSCNRMVQEEVRIQRELEVACYTINERLTALEQWQSRMLQEAHDQDCIVDWVVVESNQDTQLLVTRPGCVNSEHYVIPEHKIGWYVQQRRQIQDAQQQCMAMLERDLNALRERTIFTAQRYNDEYPDAVVSTYQANFAKVSGSFDWRQAYEFLGFDSASRYSISQDEVLRRLAYKRDQEPDKSRWLLFRQLEYLFATKEAKEQYDAALGGKLELRKRIFRADAGGVTRLLTEDIAQYFYRLDQLKAIATQATNALILPILQEHKG